MQIHNEQNIPIDIHCNKLQDWLINRRHVERDWSNDVLPIRHKINIAIQDMPEVEEIKLLLAGSYINYFHCVRLVEILKETEAKSKNIFGQYSSQRMKDWQEIVKLYEKKNIYLGEAAQSISRSVFYDVPALKKQVAKCQHMQEECARKESDYGKKANEFKEKYYSACREIGIKGENLNKELLDLIKELPVIFARITESIKCLKEAKEFYEHFLMFTLQNEDMAKSCLPMLGYLLEKGNTTIYEWKHGEAPEVIEESKPAVPLDVNNGDETSDQIDFGDGSDGIDFGDDTSSTTNGDFVHIEKTDIEEAHGIEVSSMEQEITWDTDASIVTLERPEDVGKIARGEEALTVLDHRPTRNMFLNELRELESFVDQRLSEMQSEGDILSGNQFSSASTGLQLQTTDSVAKMQNLIHAVLSEMTTTKMQNLFLIQGSNKYVDRLTSSLKQKLDLSEKMLHSQEVMREKQKTDRKEELNLKPKLELIIQKTRILKKQIEEDISKRYKGRQVNIMGEINAL